MLLKTRGIVFRFTRYGDSSIIASIFTEKAGLQSFIIKGIRKMKSGTSMALYQPLNLLEMVIYQKDGVSLNHIREAKCYYIYKYLPASMFRKTIAFFISELINKSIKEQSHPEELYFFLERTFQKLDSEAEPSNIFHLEFMCSLCKHLGFGAQDTLDITHGRFIPEETRLGLQSLLHEKKITLPYSIRKEILDLMIDFYRKHIDNFGVMKSVEVLQEILEQTKK